MEHNYIEQFDIIHRYLTRRLVPEEVEQFEEHYIDCPQCVERLQTARDLTQGLRLHTVQQALRAESGAEKRSPWFFVQWFSQRTWAFSACGFLLGLIGILIFATVQTFLLRQEVARARSAAADLYRLHDEDQQSAVAAAQEQKETEQELRGRVRQLEADLQKAQSGGAGQAGASPGWIQPIVNLPIFVLNSERGSAVTEIILSRAPTNFIISLPLEGEAKYRAYRVTLLKDQRVVWENRNARPDKDNAFTVGFNSSFFQPGRYQLQVEGGTPGSGKMTIYPFRVSKRP
jgi:hypothetical protein